MIADKYRRTPQPSFIIFGKPLIPNSKSTQLDKVSVLTMSTRIILQDVNALLRVCYSTGFFKELHGVLYQNVDDVGTIWLGFNTASFQKPICVFPKVDKGKQSPVKVTICILAATNEALPRWHKARLDGMGFYDRDDGNLGDLLKISRREDYTKRAPFRE
jgi:hypothetical protein